MTTTKKTGSLLSKIMQSRDQAAAEEEATPGSAAPAVFRPPQPAPVPAKPPGPPSGGPMHLVDVGGKPSIDPAGPGTSTTHVGKGGDGDGTHAVQLAKPNKVKKSYSIKSTNLEAIELLAWFWDKPDSQVVDQALDLLVQTMGKEITSAMELRSTKLKQRAAI
jgi:hypothetical protein